jgi:hypothetical protein
MAIQRLMVLNAVALATSMSASYAGSCSPDIDRMQARVDAKLERKAATGPVAPESTDATMNRQPTAGSPLLKGGLAKCRLGWLRLSRRPWRVRGQLTAPGEQALADVQRAIGP